MLDEILFHVGMPKTGSSAIQSMLSSNREHLENAGVVYPRAATRGDAHHELAWSAALQRRPRQDVPPLASTLDLLSSELAGHTGTAVFSSEALFHLPAGELTEVLNWSGEKARSVRVLVYVRAPASYHEGWYRQLVKTTAYDLTFDDHLRTAPVVDIAARLTAIESLAGLARFLVRPYLRGEFTHGDVTADFCEVMGIDPEWLIAPTTGTSNPSLDADLTEFKVRLHQLGADHSPRLANALTEWTLERDQVQRSLFSHQSWITFVAKTEKEFRGALNRYHLPDALNDEMPSILSSRFMLEDDFDRLVEEFEERFPVLAADVLRQINLNCPTRSN